MPRLLILLAGLAFALPAQAAFITSNPVTFAGLLDPGSFTNNFNGLQSGGPFAYSNGTYSYTIQAASGVTESNGFIYNNADSDSFILTITSNNVNALGANFFVTDGLQTPTQRPITISVTDGAGTVNNVTTPYANVNGFRGYQATGANLITSVFFSNPTAPGFYPTLDSLTVGRITPAAPPATPAPATSLLALAGLPVLSLLRRIRR